MVVFVVVVVVVVVAVAVAMALVMVVVVVVAMAVETMANDSKSLKVTKVVVMEMKDKHTSKEISQTLVADQIYLKGLSVLETKITQTD